jgi:hypothetical protein
MMPNPTINRRIPIFGNGTGIVYDPLALTYFDKTGITNKKEKNAVNTLVTAMRANSNIWNACISGIVYLVSPTSYGASLFNLMNTSFYPTTGLTPLYSAANGWIFNGVDQYFKSGFNINDNCTAYSHTTIIYNKNTTNQGTGQIWAANQSGTRLMVCKTEGGSNTSLYGAYDSANQMSVANSDSDGYFTFSSRANNDREIVRNGTSLGTSSTVITSTKPSIEFYLGCRNFNGVAGLFALCDIPTFVQTTIGLTKADSDALVTMLQAYNASVITGGR